MPGGGKKEKRFKALSHAGHKGKQRMKIEFDMSRSPPPAPVADEPSTSSGSGSRSRTAVDDTLSVKPVFQSSDETCDGTSDPDYYPSPNKRHLLTRQDTLTVGTKLAKPSHIDDTFYVGQATCVSNFVENINSNSKCNTEGCNGILVPVKVNVVGLGGSIKLDYACNGCTQRQVSFDSTTYIEGSRRSVVSLALHVAHFISGQHFSDINKSLGLGLGIYVMSNPAFQGVVELLYPVVKGMVDEICEESKNDMKSLPKTCIGSWERAVTTSDGAWLTRGSFSKNFTFTGRNFINNSLLYFLHLCQKGNVDEEETLYPGTSKSCDGFAAEKCFRQAKSEGMDVEVNWQDNDSSSVKSFKSVFPEEKNKVMFCGGHVTRAHTNQLNKLSAIKTATSTFIARHKEKYPGIVKLQCTCQKRHFPNCGCMSEKFIRQARINHSCAIVEAHHTKDPQTYKEILLQLGKYHGRNIHSWKGGNCTFHPLRVCSCNKCENKTEPKCEGTDYQSKSSLSCEFYAFLYEFETNERAKMASPIIHPEIGKGHSNFPESSHSVWTKFRSKNSNIERLHYIVSTNLGLLQSNMSYLVSKKGNTYHWILDLYSRLPLPLLQSIKEACEKSNSARMADAQYKSSQKGKDLRLLRKQGRVLEQEERKQWVKNQTVKHTYGSEDEEEEEEEGDDEANSIVQGENQADVEGALVVSNTRPNVNRRKKRCRCGSSTHLRINHRECPLRK